MIEAKDALLPLGAELQRAGLSASLLNRDGRPLLRVWHPAYPHVGETVIVTSAADGDRQWLRSSTAEWLAPADEPAAAAAQLVEQIRAVVRIHQPSAEDAPKSAGEWLRYLHSRWPGMQIWRGATTGHWWAMVSAQGQDRLLEAVVPEMLDQVIGEAVVHRVPP